MYLSQNFSLEELIFSPTAIRYGLKNIPGEKEKENLINLCKYILEPVRLLVNSPIIITSGYRSREVNKLIGGATNSQHITGQAADLTAKGYAVKQLFDLIKSNPYIQYDQMINEFDGSWLHISWAKNPRRQSMIAINRNGQTIYKAA